MPADPRHHEPDPKHPDKSSPEPARDAKARKAREVLREQAKTEIEQRPYLDTEGGE